MRHSVRAIVIISLFSFAYACRTSQNTLRPFTSDLCSAYPEGVKDHPNAWCECCVEHDLKYWMGGTRKEKKQADNDLARCVANSGYKKRGKIMFLGVQMLGGAHLPFSWRWGYGWLFHRGYKPLSSAEIKLANELLQQDQSKLIIENSCNQK